jgi:hypothetical protein
LVYNDNVALVGAQIARRIATGTYSGTFAYYVANVAGSGTNGATDEIAGMQGFLLRANMSGNLQFNNAQRLTSYSNPNFFRTQFFDLIRLQMKGSRGADETTIYFGNQGSEDFEVHTDAWKANFNSLPAPNLYTHASNKALAINGLAELTEEEIIPLSFIAAENGKQVINISHSEGFEGVNIFLEDKKLKVLHDLKGGAYSFTANQGKEESRFQLRFKPTAEREKAIEFDFLVYPNPTKDVLKVQLSKTLTSRMLITDILGRVILETNGTERETKIDVSNLPSGVYVLEVQTEAGSKSLKFVKEN